MNVGLNQCYGFAPPMLLWRIRCHFRFHGLACRFRGWNRRGRRRSEENALYHHHQKQEASDPHPWADFASRAVYVTCHDFFLNGGLTGKTIEKLGHFYLLFTSCTSFTLAFLRRRSHLVIVRVCLATPLVHTFLTSLPHSLSSFVVRIEDTVVLLWT